MFRGIDRSKTLSRSLEGMSNSLAKRRGLLPIIGVLFVVISFIIRLIMPLTVGTPAFGILDLLWTITHHLGIIIALIGILLIEPLGR
jgi:hypothetical protein